MPQPPPRAIGPPGSYAAGVVNLIGLPTNAIRQAAVMDEAVRHYIDGIAPHNRALFDRTRQLIMDAHPHAAPRHLHPEPSY